MAENPKFNNSDMFKDVPNNTGHTDIDVDNKSEVLATQGNVINSIKTFWNNIRRKLVYAITRTDTSKAVGGNYQPIYVNEDGGVQVCEPTTLTGSVNNHNINLDQINPLYSGQIVCITVTNTKTNSTSFLTINNINVYYITGVQVKESDVINNTTYLFTFISGDGNKWILNNKINVASTNNPGLMTKEQYTKLNGIEEGANKYELTAADDKKLGGVKLGYTTDGKNYKVQKDNNDNLYVNVPWTDENTHHTALLRAGDNTSTSNGSTGNTNTYLKIVDGDKVSSNLKIEGSGGTTISSSSQGIITINSPTVTSYNRLDTASIKNPSVGYTIKGSGNNANQFHYLAGDGTWVNGRLVPNNGTEGKILKWGSSGPYWADAE